MRYIRVNGERYRFGIYKVMYHPYRIKVRAEDAFGDLYNEDIVFCSIQMIRGGLITADIVVSCEATEQSGVQVLGIAIAIQVQHCVRGAAVCPFC